MRALLEWLVTALQAGLWLLLVVASLHLLRSALWAFSQPSLDAGDAGDAPALPPNPPLVTVQLPLRNERDVAARLLDYVAALDWPRLQIQVLDDSDDETVQIVDERCAQLRAAGHDVEIVRRPTRAGFKAGALTHALPTAKGEWLLLLDADSQPRPDLIRRLIAPMLHDDRLAFVQARWSFSDENDSLLTRTQAIILHALFTVEQARLSALGRPLQFNGTAGLWRRAALERAGGWLGGRGASVTEDLDLSYRVHLQGGRGITRPEIDVATELPSSMAAFRTQQQRWVRGGGEVLRALGRRLFAGSMKDGLSMLAHLARHGRQPLLLLSAIWLPAIALGWLKVRWSPPHAWSIVLAMLFLSVGSYYAATLRRLHRAPLAGFLYAPVVMALSIGLAPAMTRALLQGWLSPSPGEFVRTPKRGDRARSSYRALGDAFRVIEITLALFAVAGATTLALHGAVASPLALLGLFALPLFWVGLAR